MNDATPEQSAIKKLMSHRLSSEDGTLARSEWLEIVEGTHTSDHVLSVVNSRLWEGISSEKRELLRSFLRYVQTEISKLSRPSSRFDFRNGSIGNFFLTGARLVSRTRSCTYAVLWISRIIHLPPFFNFISPRNNDSSTDNKYQSQYTYCGKITLSPICDSWTKSDISSFSHDRL
jgi:hypothetical protein